MADRYYDYYVSDDSSESDFGDWEESPVVRNPDPMKIYFGAARDFVADDKKDEIERWVFRRVQDGEDEIEEEVEWDRGDEWVESRLWSEEQHIFLCLEGPTKPDDDGAFLHDGVPFIATTMAPLPDATTVKEVTVTPEEMNKYGRPRCLILPFVRLSYYEAWIGKSFLWRCDYGKERPHSKEICEDVTWTAELRKNYLDGLGVDKPWKPLEREQEESLVDLNSPAHPRARAIRNWRKRGALVLWRTRAARKVVWT